MGRKDNGEDGNGDTEQLMGAVRGFDPTYHLSNDNRNENTDHKDNTENDLNTNKPEKEKIKMKVPPKKNLIKTCRGPKK